MTLPTPIHLPPWYQAVLTRFCQLLLFSFPFVLPNKYSSAIINELLQKLPTFKPMELSRPILCAQCLLSPDRLGTGPTSHDQTPCTWCSGHGRLMSTGGKSCSQPYYFPFPPTLSLFYNSSCLGNALHLDGEVNYVH